jgi:RNA polymerase sigma factor (sigma-70 family)
LGFGANEPRLSSETADDSRRRDGDGVDHDLVGRARRGDREAFASLAVVVGDRLFAVAHRILLDADVAEEATQHALLTIWRDLRQLRDPARFDAWSYALLLRACHTESRPTRRLPPDLHVVPVEDDAETEDGLGSFVDRDQLERSYRRLSFDHRAVIVLHHYLDLPIDEMVETLGVPVGNVRSRLRYAMRWLRAGLVDRPAIEPSAGRPTPSAVEVTRAVRSWLRLGPAQLPDRVLDAVLDEVADRPQRGRWLPRW